MLCNTNEVTWESLPTHNPPRQQCSAAQRSAVQFLVTFCFMFQLCLTKIDGPELTLSQLPIQQILAKVVPVFRHTGSQLATEDHRKPVRRIRAFSTYALTKLDYITHGAVLPAPSLMNLQVISNRRFSCVCRLPKWAPSDFQMDSPQVQPNCNSKEQPSMQTQQALATHKNLQTTWALTESHRDGTGFHILHREGHPPEVRATRGQSWG